MAEIEKKADQVDENPYVGPRTFSTEEAPKFFGRDREARNLIALIVSERLVLFYAQSGAGKSSLINTKVIPGLHEEGFEVLPTGAVRGHSGFDVATENIFIYNLISSLQQKDEEIADLGKMRLSDFLDCLVHDQGAFYYDCDYLYPADEALRPRVLLIDQFEEILTTNTSFWEQREGFFKQLAQAIAEDDQLWVVLTMREDFVGGLDPYLHHLPEAFQNHFYMQRLKRDAALQAITMPVAQIRPFEDQAAQTLVDNLRRIELQGQEQEAHWGEFVEPVQLQAVCYQMWQKLQNQPGDIISEEEVQRYADVNTALINFYENTIASTVAETGVSEIELRAWFETDLVTDAGTRNMVFRGDEKTGSMDTSVADYVNSKFIIRENARPGGIWYELIHDRFVEPIVKANRQWYLDQPLIQLCQDWVASGRSDTYLLSRQQLQNYSDTNWQALGQMVGEFIAASQAAIEDQEMQMAEEERRRQQEELRQEQANASRFRRLTSWLTVVALFAVIATVIALYFMNAARIDSEEAQTARRRAVANANLAVTSRFEAITAQANSEANAKLASTSEAEALAAQASSEANAALAGTREAEARAAQATSQVAATTAVAGEFELQTKVSEVETAQAQAVDSLANQEALLSDLLQQSLTATPAPTPSAAATGANTGLGSSFPVIPTLNVQEDLAVQLAEVRLTQTAVAAASDGSVADDETKRDTIFLGASVEGVPIEAIRLGDGPKQILLVGGIHSAKSPSTVDIAEEMIAYYEENPQEIPANISLIIVPDLNPDSQGSGIDGHFNANGVDLNRNWNCGWVADPIVGDEIIEGAGGRAPNSEPETQGLADYIRGNRPTAVIAWYAAIAGGEVNPGGCPDVSRSGLLKDLYIDGSAYKPGEFNTGSVFPGVFSNWLDSFRVPAVGVYLPSHSNPDFAKNQAAVQHIMDFYAQQ